MFLWVGLLTIIVCMPVLPANGQDEANWRPKRMGASKITKSELMGMLEAHKAWISTTWKKSDPKQGRRLQLLGADLTGEDLKGINLRSVDLRGADLREADLRRAKMSEADFRQADFRGADLISADLRNSDLRKADLRRARLNFADLRNSDLRQADLRGADLISADLREAKTRGVKLEKANLNETKFDKSFKNNTKYYTVWELNNTDGENINSENKKSLRKRLPGMDLREAFLVEVDLGGTDKKKTNLRKTKLQKAVLNDSNLSNTDLSEANLSDADLIGADLRGAVLIKTVMRNADLTEAKLAGAIFEPKAGSLPDIAAISSAEGLSELRYEDSPHALVELREAFKKAGLLAQERQITYAIKYSRRKELNKQKSLWGKLESLFNLIFFELTCLYGMKPGRPLLIMFVLICILTVPYTIALKWPPKKDGIWKMWFPDRAHKQLGTDEPIRLRLGFLSAVKTGFFFSILSAFSIGWREINVRMWIVRLQQQEYILRATGWVRTVSGFQSLISVYLLALWILTYFGRLFETV